MLKRAFDLLASGTALALFSPLFAVLALIVRLESPGPVFFRQPRVGKDGKLFDIYKFRTMRVAPHEDPRSAAPVPDVSDFTSYVFDPLYGGKQYTRIGQFLRSTSLDELPNLLNVLRGDMSIIGPRPDVPELVSQYKPEYHRRHRVKPGITGLSQVNGRADLTYEQIMDYDLRYVDEHSFVSDLTILARTLPAVLSRKGAR
jgi:lipopolysaccharide/colanic/teichoic acid biosynthesis glycosyltransferase